MKKHFRAFFGISLSEDICAQITRLIQNLLEIENFNKIKWINEENLHITLTFLGAISEKTSKELIESVSKKISSLPSFRVTFSSLTAFPSKEHPRVLVLSSKEPKPLITLEALIKQEAIDCGITIESRPYIPHITIARIKDKRHFDNLNAIKITPIMVNVNKATLFRSDLSPAGVVYTRIATFDLS